MPRSASSRRNDEDDEPEEDDPSLEEDEEEEEEPAPRRRSRPPPRPARRRPRPTPVRRWRSSEGEEEEEEEAPSSEKAAASGKKPIYWRARDSLFFEPLVAVAVIVVLLVSLYAYTQNWPPIYVVESPSMQHGSSDQLGLINTGDLVLAQKIPFSQITTYVSGIKSGYTTYGEYGDVLLYWPFGSGSTPIIHRAILYLEWNPLGFYNATELAGLPCGSAPNAVYAFFPTASSPPECNTTELFGHLDLYRIGWQSTNISIPLDPSILGRQSGFLTMGDNNAYADQLAPIQLSTLVESGWIIGVARGMIPWFGSIKLLLDGNAGSVPPQSWQFMGLTIVGIILAAFGIHYALRTEGIETPLRRKEDEEAREKTEEEAAESGPRRWLLGLRRRHSDEEEAEEEAPERRRTRPPPAHPPARRGRPVPHVKRAEKPKKKPPADDEL